MKASELIKKLQRLVDQYGDKTVYDEKTGRLKFSVDLNK